MERFFGGAEDPRVSQVCLEGSSRTFEVSLFLKCFHESKNKKAAIPNFGEGHGQRGGHRAIHQRQLYTYTNLTSVPCL